MGTCVTVYETKAKQKTKTWHFKVFAKSIKQSLHRIANICVWQKFGADNGSWFFVMWTHEQYIRFYLHFINLYDANYRQKEEKDKNIH